MYRLLAISTFLFTLPSVALAHEKWFVNGSLPHGPKPLLFTAWSSLNASFVLLGIFALVAALLIHFAVRPLRWMRRLRRFLGSYKEWTPSVLRTLTGLLLFTASFSRFLFAPDLSTALLPAPVERVLLAVQLLVGLGFILGAFPRFMSSLGLTLYLLSIAVLPSFSALHYISFVGIFIYLFIVGDPALPKTRGIKIFPHLAAFLNLREARPYAMAILRLFVGFSFILVAARYKIYEPAYALEFLRTHPVNFIHGMGFANFTNEMFVLAAGITEILLGSLMMLGLLPRLAGLLMFVLFTITLSIFGIYELLGHLPLYGVAFALLTQGGGERWSAEATRAGAK